MRIMNKFPVDMKKLPIKKKKPNQRFVCIESIHITVPLGYGLSITPWL